MQQGMVDELDETHIQYASERYDTLGRHNVIQYIDENGNVVVTDKIDEVSYSWQHQTMGRLEKDYMAIKFPEIKAEIDFAANLPRINSYNNFVEIPENRNQSDLIRYVDEETVRFFYGRRDLSEFEDFVNTLYETYGLARMLVYCDTEEIVWNSLERISKMVGIMMF